MRSVALFLAALSSLLTAPVMAQAEVHHAVGGTRFVSAAHASAERNAIAAYGPFRVLDATHAALVGVTTVRSPDQFNRMLADFPGIASIEFVECPGTHDDRANLYLARMIREAGISTIVREGGSVRSGAVELFLAGVSRQISDDAEFAVHAWLNALGQEASDLPADAPEHAKYLRFYQEVGMSLEEARNFYAMTNSVPFESAMWLTGREMRRWIAADVIAPATSEMPRMAYLDLDNALN